MVREFRSAWLKLSANRDDVVDKGYCHASGAREAYQKLDQRAQKFVKESAVLPSQLRRTTAIAVTTGSTMKQLDDLFTFKSATKVTLAQGA